MTRSEKRFTLDRRDANISTDRCEHDFILNYWQLKEKFSKHYGLFDIVPQSETVCEGDVLIFRDHSLAHQKTADEWYVDAQFQAGTERNWTTINVYDSNTGILAVYIKKEGGPCPFLTVCKLTKTEKAWLRWTNGNFLTDTVLDENQWSAPKDFGDVCPNK